jgi:hypothetical protein
MTRPTKDASPAVSFSPEALQAVISKATAEAVALATAAMKAELQAALAAKPVSLNNKSEKSSKNELAVIRTFKKAGFGVVVPHVDVLTFNRWMAQGLRPREGEKSQKVSNLRLFHVSQCRTISPEEKAALQEQKDAAEARKASNVLPMTTA